MNIQKAFCINLARRPDRWIQMQSQFSRLGFDFPIDRFNAVDGKESIGEDSYLAGTFGCIASHIGVANIANSSNLDVYMAIEDDAVFHPESKSILAAGINELPDDWNFCYLGGSNISKPIKLSKSLGICQKTLATTCYFVKTSFATNVLIPSWESRLDLMRRNKIPPEADTVLIELQGQFDFHIFNPRITYQEQGYSDIQRSNVDYSHQRDF
jgi:glycosyl transferase family 25